MHCLDRNRNHPAEWGRTAAGPRRDGDRNDRTRTSRRTDHGPSGPRILPGPPRARRRGARRFSGTTVNYYSGQIGVGSELDNLLMARFTEETGIHVNFVPKSDDTTEDYAVYDVLFAAKSPDIDVLALDIIWPASFADHLVNLRPALDAEAAQHFPGIIENNTIAGSLVAMPQFGDFGMLYYRTDLLAAYGFGGPPATWDELELMARTIQEGERAAGNANFVGLVFQGAAYEGGTCNALEWIASHGGSIIEEGVVTLNNEATLRAMERARGWVGTIAPETVVSFREEDARELFQRGDAAFMRNWPYAYAMGNAANSPIRERFDVAPLPHDGSHPGVGTVGGWQLAVSAYSPNPEAAIAFVRYLTSAEVQKWRAIEGGYVPTIRSVSEDPQVIAALPFLERLQGVVRIARPSRETGTQYNEASAVIFQGTNSILRGAEPSQTLATMSADLEALVQRGTTAP
ncbi:MAG: ABC transporter substrate-binding protein [Chloroflexaceae bacterium]|nr:ABC transporter substrate-binding protein [Chloroflexaceae bacterium]